jgi:hypothetical protein
LNKDKYDIIEIEVNKALDINEEQLRLTEFLKKIRINQGIQNKFVIVKTSNVY